MAIRDGETQTQFTLRLARDEWQGQALDEVEGIVVGIFGRKTEIGRTLLTRLTLLRAELERRSI